MGLFSRNESANASGRRASQRSAGSSEAQVNELRGRARRRLIGALALVVAAVIIVPMLLDTSPEPAQPQTPIVVPAIVPPTPALDPVAQPDNTGDQSSGVVAESPLPTPDAAGAIDQVAQADTTSPTEAPATPAPKPAPVVTPKAPEKHVEAKPTPEPKQKPAQRTDDGSVAIALLEGRTPPKPSVETSKGSFVLQIAAYTTDKDAQSRRDRLVSSGVTNAYVETASSGGKSTYRLRVGPFPSREAAQAAQTRLRALGYDNGFISSK